MNKSSWTRILSATARRFCRDGMMVVVESFEDKPIGVRLPDQVTLEVRETEPVVKGQTAASSINRPCLKMMCGLWCRPLLRRATGLSSIQKS